MITRYLTIATLLFCGSLCATAQDNLIEEQLEEQFIEIKDDLRDIVHTIGKPSSPSKVRQLSELGDTVVNYEDRIINMPDYFYEFIDQYKVAAQKVFNGEISWLSDPTDLTTGAEYSGGAYIYPLHTEVGTTDFTFPIGSNSDAIKQAARDAAQPYIDQALDSLKSFLPYAYLCVNFDHPEVFWIGNAFNYGIGSGISISGNPSTGQGTATYTLRYRFILRASGFDIRCNGYPGYDYRSPANIAKGVQLFNSSVQNILEQCQSDSKRKRLLKMYDWLTHHNSYNRYYASGSGRNDIGDTPWTPISALEGNTSYQAPVCEGYARAMKVLCDRIGIPCILMAGDGCATPTSNPIGHMWNYVQMEDGNWYAIDATWDDPYIGNLNKAVSGYESHNWFLLGSTVEVAEDWTFLDSHPEQWANSYKNEGSFSWEFRSGPVLSPLSWVSPDPYDPNGNGNTDLEDIQLMAEKIANNNDDIEDVDGNDRITIGDLVRLINRYISLSE